MDKKILIIDDEQMIRNLLMRALIKKGYPAETIGDSRKALELIETNIDDYCLFIVDMKMPEVSGLEIIKKIKEIRKDSKVIIITGSFSDEIRRVANSYDIENYIAKPFELKELYRVVSNVLPKPKEQV